MSPTMPHVCVSLFFMIHLVFGSTIYMTKFHTVQKPHLGNMGIRCATLVARSASRIAAKLHATSGYCEGLTWQWGENKDYMTGYAYIEKKSVTKIYTPPLLEYLPETAFFLPFNISNGGETEITFTKHNDTDNIFTVDLVNTLDIKYDVIDDVLEEFPMRLSFKRDTETAKVKSGYDSFTLHDTVFPLTISFGEPHKITVQTLATSIKIWYDDVQLFHYTPTVCPGSARLIRLRNTLETSIHNITFKAA